MNRQNVILVVVVLSILLVISWVALAQVASRPPHRPPIITPDTEAMRLALLDVVGSIKVMHEGNVTWATNTDATHVLTQNDGWVPEETIDGVKGWIEQQQDLVVFWARHETTLLDLGPPE